MIYTLARWGRHLVGTFLNHANFGTLFEGMQSFKGSSGNLSQADAIGLGTGARFGDLTKSLDRNWSKGLDFQSLDKIRLNSEAIGLGTTNWRDDILRKNFWSPPNDPLRR